MNNQKTYDLGQVEVVISVDYKDIDNVITDYFNISKRYDCVTYEEWDNYDESHEMIIDGKYKFPDESIVYLVNNNVKYNTREYLNYMAARGVIKKGKYVIKNKSILVK